MSEIFERTPPKHYSVDGLVAFWPIFSIVGGDTECDFILELQKLKDEVTMVELFARVFGHIRDFAL